jgi:hypothetical protein
LARFLGVELPFLARFFRLLAVEEAEDLDESVDAERGLDFLVPFLGDFVK